MTLTKIIGKLQTQTFKPTNMKRRNKLQLFLALLFVSIGLFIAQTVRWERMTPIQEVVTEESCACLTAADAIKRHPENPAVIAKAIPKTATFSEITTLRVTTVKGMFPFTTSTTDTINCVLKQKS